MNYIYVLFFFIIALSFWVVFSKNAITSILCLIGVFFLSGLFFLLLGADFLALMLILVYGGAISILFLFIIMMLNLRLVEVYNVNLYYVPFYFFILSLLFSMYMHFFFESAYGSLSFILWGLPLPLHLPNLTNLINYKSNLHVLGVSLFNYFYFYVLMAATILFVAMVGAIYLTQGSEKKARVKLAGEKHRGFLSYWKPNKKKYL